MRSEQPPNPEMRLGAQSFRHQRVGRLLDAIVDELVRARPPVDQPGADSLPHIRVDQFLGCAVHQ